MDEPTSVLTPQEVEQLFETLRQLAAEGCSILYICTSSHEIVALCEAATILRGGKVVGALRSARRRPRDRWREMMIGAKCSEVARSAARRRARAGARSVARPSACPSPASSASRCRSVSFEVRAGEIFGVAGVAGNGQNELLAR